ncbi:hypothetical protein RHOER0001_6630 [Rhodococcus erythropolis SK121]|nr:hypothetical protein RHOER0001_6630 [Rhodococcus erythropolis SK121]
MMCGVRRDVVTHLSVDSPAGALVSPDSGASRPAWLVLTISQVSLTLVGSMSRFGGHRVPGPCGFTRSRI